MNTTAPVGSGLFLGLLLIGNSAFAADNRISASIETVEVKHNGETVIIQRGHDRGATLPEIFQKSERGCPPFCIQPMEAAPGVETVGELEVLDYLSRMSKGDDRILLIDSRTPDWVMRGTIPGAVNIPWNRINTDTAGTFETPTEAEGLVHILADEFGASYDPANETWDFSNAKTLILFCNGIWCPQSTANLQTLVELGYPVHKLKWYRGGMQDWVSVGLTSVKP
ncbi:rhodanese-like domain-containing protein [Thiohalocapsa marina]|uniref:Rhodanese-like domain-containing protein n=1 Tax=Thiohalocapsa marina TaxID=424902 RepID=A0A5M8FGE5_9GAMM|nr:rhodanese-like domain-containing protein [Thiohalocapsa marina]KAA6183797.1 rhodanese-like domain-containing protein [Thiohalocapsa marina]